MEIMGYRAGITYQAVPYDFRRAINYLDTDIIIKKSLLKLKELTGKKSVIIAHSYGTLHTLNALSKMK